MKRTHLFLMAAAAAALLAAAAGAQTKSPADYGRVVINSFSAREGMAPVVFDHWLHRATYTCRLCHVDIGFGLKANATGIRAADNAKGLFCGACHNGKMEAGGRKVFAACGGDKSDKRCNRCHSQGRNVKGEVDFAAFTAKLPKDKFGNGINWEKAAEDGQIKLSDHLEGVSIAQPAKPVQSDFSIKARSGGMGDIIFSHKKHVQWNGCEVCHPEIFKGGKRGAQVYTMDDIRQKKFCGVCHGSVAFPQEDCGRCHAKPVR
jgi:c(7)-type cytochrome triheme protein